jgi:predicted acyl esterase
MKKNWQELVSQPKYGIKEERDIYVPMRDGVRLAINVFKPDAKGKFPALVSLSPYVKDSQDAYLLPPQSIDKPLWDGGVEAGDTKYVVARGYVHIIADQRGTGKSEGQFGPKTSIGQDGYDLVEWAANQPWCDGNVGMMGYSAYSGAQFHAAVQQPPHLKAIYLSGFAPDAYRGPSYTGGMLCLFTGRIEKTCGTSGACFREYVPITMQTLPKEEVERRRQESLNSRDIRYCPNAYQVLHFPNKNPRLFDAMMNPYDGPYWWALSPYRHVDKVRVPTYLASPWGHFFMPVGLFEMFEGLKVPKKLMFTKERHEPRPWRTALDVQIRWYDHWLKGIDTGIMDEPPLSLYINGINQWRYEKEWPLPGTEWIRFYLRCWEGLSTEGPEIFSDEPDCFMQQPLHLSLKRDCVRYLTPPLAEDLQVIGPGAFYFYASIDQDDTNWIVKLFDVDERGAEVYKFGTSYLKASHRAVDKNMSKPYAPWHPHTKESIEVIKPGGIYEYAIGLSPMGNVFKAGHRIKLEIYSMEHGKDPEMIDHYHTHVCSSKTTLHKIYRDEEHQSHLLLPVVPKK